jgi:cobalamin biosynthesis protein CobW
MAADLIVLNKTDLIDAGVSEKLKSEVVAIVPRAVKVIAARDGRVDVAVLLGLHAAAEDDLAARPSHHDAAGLEHEHDDFESFVVMLPEIDDPDALIARLKTVSETHDVLRMKGFVAIAGKPLRLAVQGVGTRFNSAFDRPWAHGGERRGHVVVIGETGLDRAAIEAGIRG